MTSALYFSLAIPPKDILFPEMYLAGLRRYINKCFSFQTIPHDFMDLLYEKLVPPAGLPTTPASAGAAAVLLSP
jgi:hypothetical protein